MPKQSMNCNGHVIISGMPETHSLSDSSRLAADAKGVGTVRLTRKAWTPAFVALVAEPASEKFQCDYSLCRHDHGALKASTPDCFITNFNAKLSQRVFESVAAERTSEFAIKQLRTVA